MQSALSGPAAAKFAQLSSALSRGVNTGQAVFATRARQGRDAFTALPAGMVMAALLMAVGGALGLSRRLAEYR